MSGPASGEPQSRGGAFFMGHPEHNKARSVGPGRLSAQPWCRPKGVGRSCAKGLLGNSLIVRSGVFSCGRSCRRWHLGPGVNRDVPLGPGHLRRCSGQRQG